MTVCGIKQADGVCVMGECPHIKNCCPVVWDKSGKPMTNEEWLKQANTEQLANVFFEYRYINATPQQQLWLSANEDFVKGGIVEWLKQQHRD